MPSLPLQSRIAAPQIDGLQLHEKVGEGGMGAVYRALHLNLQRSVAVKVLHAAMGKGAQPAWQRESRTIASLTHPNVVTIHDAGRIDGHDYLVLEYVAGGSLRSRMRPGQPWALDDAIAALECIARALCHIHAQGVLHLDLKPENILYGSDGQIKITDFGLSVSGADPKKLLEDRGGAGTADYCAPEQRFGLAVDARCDVFSLAAVAYELLTGEIPGRVYVPVSRRRRGLPPGLDDVLRRGLARDPNDRYASMEQFRESLVGACRVRRRRTWVWPVAAAAGIAAMAVSWFAAHAWRATAPQDAASPTKEPLTTALLTTAPQVAPPQAAAAQPHPDSPSHLWILHEKPEDLSLFAGGEGGELSSGSSDVPVHQIRIAQPPQDVPPGLALANWPLCRPALILRSPKVWGFVFPLTDRTLGQRVVKHWPSLLRSVASPKNDYVKSGGFEPGSLDTHHRGNRWRVGDIVERKPDRQICLAAVPNDPNDWALLLNNLDPAYDKEMLGCYQPLERAPPPGAVIVLRYHARSLCGRGALNVYPRASFSLPEKETGAAANRLRRIAVRLPPEGNVSAPDFWLFRASMWVVPTIEWQTYVVVYELPPYPTRAVDRNLVIDESGGDQVWVDDVTMFVWQPESAP